MKSMIDSISNVFNTFNAIWGYLVFALVLVILITLCFKYKAFANYGIYIVFALIMVVGSISAIQLHDILDVESKEIGSAIHLENNEDDYISKFEFGVIELSSDDGTTYSNIKSFASEEFDGIDKDYVILFNDKPCDNITTNAGSIEGVLVLNFYDTNANVITTARLNILIEYLDKETKVSTSITNSNYSVSYLNSYMELHGVVIEVVERS